MKKKVNTNVYNFSGMLIFEEGQIVEVREVVKSKGYHGRSSGTWYPEKIVGYKLKGKHGIWLLEMFNTCLRS